MRKKLWLYGSFGIGCLLLAVAGIVFTWSPCERFSVGFGQQEGAGLPVSIGIYIGKLPTYWDKWTKNQIWQEWVESNKPQLPEY